MRKMCNLCGRRVSFQSVREGLGGQLAEFGYPYDIDSFETLNVDEYLCPECGASDRDRLYRLFLGPWLKKRAGRGPRVLDFAPSVPLQNFLKSIPGVAYRSADLFMSDVDDKVDITDMPLYQDDSFDLVICSHILEHVDDDRAAMRELRRVLDPSGIAIVMTPIAPPGTFDEDPSVEEVAERWRRFAQDDHVRLYDRESLVGRLQKAGLRVSQRNRWQLGALACLRYGIAPGSRLYTVSPQ